MGVRGRRLGVSALRRHHGGRPRKARTWLCSVRLRSRRCRRIWMRWRVRCVRSWRTSRRGRGGFRGLVGMLLRIRGRCRLVVVRWRSVCVGRSRRLRRPRSTWTTCFITRSGRRMIRRRSRTRHERDEADDGLSLSGCPACASVVVAGAVVASGGGCVGASGLRLLADASVELAG